MQSLTLQRKTTPTPLRWSSTKRATRCAWCQLRTIVQPRRNSVKPALRCSKGEGIVVRECKCVCRMVHKIEEGATYQNASTVTRVDDLGRHLAQIPLLVCVTVVWLQMIGKFGVR